MGHSCEEHLNFMMMADWKKAQMVERAAEQYRFELGQLNGLLRKLNAQYDGLIDIEKSVKNFKKSLEEELS